MKIQINKLLFLLFIISGLLTFSVMSAYGDDYKFEVGIPGIVGAGKSLKAISLQEFTSKLIKILFPIAGILAFAMIVFAGFEYATSGGNTSKQKDAQDRIANAIIGLILLFAFWIIIYTINPDILKTQNLTLTPLSASSAPTSTIDTLPGFTKICDGPLHPTPIPYSPIVLNIQRCFYIKNDILSSLRTLYNNTGKTWVITEACQALVPNSSTPCYTFYQHQDACHQTGECIDAALIKSNPTQTEIDSFIKAANTMNLDVLNEYSCTFSYTTGPSFHVVVHQSNCTNTDCWFCAK